MIEKYAAKIHEKTENNVIKDAIMANGINGATLKNKAVVEMNSVFSEEIETGKVANQKQSGRCWILQHSIHFAIE